MMQKSVYHSIQMFKSTTAPQYMDMYVYLYIYNMVELHVYRESIKDIH